MTKNQHYIPQFYQKIWECEKKGHIWQLDKQHKNNIDKGIRMKAIRTQNSENCLYEVDKNNPNNNIENLYGKFETRYAKKYRNLIKDLKKERICKISDNDKHTLCKLFANFSARHPINIYDNEINNNLASHFILDRKASNNKIDPNINKRYMQNYIALIEGSVFKEVESNFARFLWNYCNIQIFTSDEENIVYCDNIIGQISYSDEYYFPMSPTILAKFSTKSYVKDKPVVKITSEEYQRFIQLYLSSPTVKRIYASNKHTLENIGE